MPTSDWHRGPPSSEAELIERARWLARYTIGELADELGERVPFDQSKAKGWVGQLVESALAATGSNRAVPDFERLGIEMKTVPVQPNGRPRESTFLTTASYEELLHGAWQTSRARHKTRRILWVPIESDPFVPLASRRIGVAVAWSPSMDDDLAFTEDWAEFQQVARESLGSLDARLGKVFQLRPKARDASVSTRARTADGTWVDGRPLGFYLRSPLSRRCSAFPTRRKDDGTSAACFHALMSSRRIVLRVRAESGCPLFQAGDHMVLDLPGVDAGASNAICVLAATKFLSETDSSKCEESVSPLEKGEFRCPRSRLPVIFDVETVGERHEPKVTLGNLKDNIPAAVAHLRTIPIFQTLPAPFLAQLAHRIHLETYEPGETVLMKGHLARAFFVVAKGEAEVMAFADEEMTSVVRSLKEKDCFGEMSLLTNAPAAASVVASEQLTVYSISKDDFDQMLRENPHMASRFVRLMATRLLAANFLLVKEGSKSFSGKLSVMSLPTVIQVLSESGRSGTLVLERYEGLKGEIGFSEGRIFQARVGDIDGEAAFYELLNWKRGDFWLDTKKVPKEDNVQTGVMGLMLEGMRRLDEASRDEANA
ncbi:MAG: cyclic nucleotide-binding domain-containing protein [Myxococcales bacterium]|nr:cyclic nucleotide-binding domain-containing protein [Myxococcales bacterium]